MVRVKERHLLVSVDVLDSDASLIQTSELHSSIRAAWIRHLDAHAAFKAADSGQPRGDTKQPPPQQQLQTRLYSPHAGLCMLHIGLSHSQALRECVERIKFARQRPVRMKVIKMSGNAVLARRAYARRLEESLRKCVDQKGQKAMRSSLAQLEEAMRR